MCCHGVARPSKIGQQRVVCLTLLLAKFALCASSAFKLACEVLGTQLALRIRACRPSTPTACHAAWWLARKRRPREPRLHMLCPHSIVTPERANSIAKLFDLLPASDGDAASPLLCPESSTGLQKAVGFPSEPCLHAHPFATSCSNSWVLHVSNKLLSRCHNRSRQACVTPQGGATSVRVQKVAERGKPHLQPHTERSGDTGIRLRSYLQHPSMASSNGYDRLALDLSRTARASAHSSVVRALDMNSLFHYIRPDCDVRQCAR